MFSQYMEQLEKSPYVVEDFVEKLFWRTNSVNSENFDPQLLSETFTQTIKDLRILQERQQRKCERLEAALSDDQKIHAKHIDKLLEKHSLSVEQFHQLDEKINSVAGKIIHLGEQLENVNTPRTRTAEALKLLNYMGEFLVPGPVVNDIFTNKDNVSTIITCRIFSFNNRRFSFWKQLTSYRNCIWLLKTFQPRILVQRRRKSSQSMTRSREA